MLRSKHDYKCLLILIQSSVNSRFQNQLPRMRDCFQNKLSTVWPFFFLLSSGKIAQTRNQNKAAAFAFIAKETTFEALSKFRWFIFIFTYKIIAVHLITQCFINFILIYYWCNPGFVAIDLGKNTNLKWQNGMEWAQFKTVFISVGISKLVFFGPLSIHL